MKPNPYDSSEPELVVEMAQRALNDFVSHIVKNRSLALDVRPFEPTASERYIYGVLRDNVDRAKRAYMDHLRATQTDAKRQNDSATTRVWPVKS